MQAISAVAEDVSEQFSAIGESLGALKSSTREVATKHVVKPVVHPHQRCKVTMPRQRHQLPCQLSSGQTDLSMRSRTSRWSYVGQTMIDSPSPSNSKLFAASETTEKLLNGTFSKGVPNATRKQW